MGRFKPWLVAATLFTLGNAAGVGWAIARGETSHALLHVGLMILGLYLEWLADAPPQPRGQVTLPAAEARLEQLQQSMDSIAVEVERIGEAQRFSVKQAAEREAPPR
jgi:hypothetical protein